MKWFVDIDVVSFFDNINHDILLGLLRKRIDDERFLRLIAGMLKAGYLEDWTFHTTFSGTPQGVSLPPSLPMSTCTNSMSSSPRSRHALIEGSGGRFICPTSICPPPSANGVT